MTRTFIHTLLFLVLALPAMADESGDDFLSGFVVGKYRLIGQAPDSAKTYSGLVELASDDNVIKVRRLIGGMETIGSGFIEQATGDGVPVLRIRFVEDGSRFEETCLIDGDLDNYARLTCYLYQPGVKIDRPGLEAMFIDRN